LVNEDYEKCGLLSNPSPLPPSLTKGRGEYVREGGEAPSKKCSPSPRMERGIKGVRLTNNHSRDDKL